MMITWINNSSALLITILSLVFLFRKKWVTATLWRATVTPLASIIGSGFLVAAPLLLLTTGRWALPAMLAIVIFAYALGESLRFNIQHLEPQLTNLSSTSPIIRIETLSQLALGFAYIISVSFYLKLLSAFILHGMRINNTLYENTLTTLLLLFIGIVGKMRGLSMLELLETYSVNVKLSIIFALIITYFLYNGELIIKGEWLLKIYSHESGWMAFRKVLGILIIVQGFETSRYLGHKYAAAIRIKTMRYAQWISGGIYLLFVALAMVVFNDIHKISETTIIDLCHIVSPVLPILLILAAIMSQFSAAVADTIGSGGLLVEATREKITINNSYLLITLTALALIWLTNIYKIISIASKAFAIYYALQIILSLITLNKMAFIKLHWVKNLLFILLLIFMLLVIILGIPVE